MGLSQIERRFIYTILFIILSYLYGSIKSYDLVEAYSALLGRWTTRKKLHRWSIMPLTKFPDLRAFSVFNYDQILIVYAYHRLSLYSTISLP